MAFRFLVVDDMTEVSTGSVGYFLLMSLTKITGLGLVRQQQDHGSEREVLSPMGTQVPPK